MSNTEELRLVVKELQSLQEQATLPRVKDILSLDIRKLQTEIIQKEEKLKSATAQSPTETASPIATETKPARIYTKEITTYGWDQSDKFMKVYVTLNGVQNIDKDNVTSEFTERSFRLKVNNLNEENFYVHVANLHDHILLEGSYHKIKTDMVLLMLKKKNPGKTWAFVTVKEKKTTTKKSPKPEESANADPKDPQDGLMDMLKQMYDDGDDEMKRTISKAWTESRGKPQPGQEPSM